MAAIKLTAKRQATLPKQLCEEMHIQEGDTLAVEKQVVNGKAVWCLLPPDKSTLKCFGIAGKHAKGKSHRLEDIKASVEEGWGEE